MTLSEYFDKDIADVWAEIKASHDSNEVLKLRAKLGNLERHRDYYRAKHLGARIQNNQKCHRLESAPLYRSQDMVHLLNMR